MNYQSFKQSVIARAEALGITEYELYYMTAESTSISAFAHEMNEFSASTEGGVCFRCIVDGKMGYASTESLTQEQAASIVEKAADNARTLEAEEPVFLAAGGQVYASLDRENYELPETEELIRSVLDTQEKLYAAGAVDGCTSRGIRERSMVGIFNSKGLDLCQENTVAGFIVGAVVARGEEKTNDYQIALGKLDTLDTQVLTQKAVDTALGKLGGEAAPTGVYPVVFDPEAMSDLLGVFSGVFSSEAAQKGLSKFAKAEDTVVASPMVTIVDDPFHPENPQPMPFDAEGSPTCKKNVVEQGVLKTLLYNLKTANMAGKKTTGNAAKANYDAPIVVRPFSMYLASGEYTQAQLLEKAQNGVFINSLSGLHAGANPVTGDFSLQSAGFMIEYGQKTRAVKSFTVAGNFYDLLKGIIAVGDDLRLPMATGMTAYGAPSVLVEGLSIAGK
ncbi:MAG: TldD/PmbA family protein [Ruminococcaceae bacterium]|nr:TldD/PmbA family protein [Oscillospiraceae bacterium]